MSSRRGKALVYCEVENFQSERTDKGVYRTTLKSRIEISTVHVVW